MASSGGPGTAPALFVVSGAPLLHPEQQVFEAMLAGWRDQQLARNLKADTISERLGAVSRFAAGAARADEGRATGAV